MTTRIRSRLRKLEAANLATTDHQADTCKFTVEETLLAMARVYEATGDRRLPAWFIELPPADQLARWGEAVERGDFDPCGLTRVSEADTASCAVDGANAVLPAEDAGGQGKQTVSLF